MLTIFTPYFSVNLLQLFAGYRGYTIDYIKSLNLLDDSRISADERHLFKGMSKLKGMF